MMTMMMMMKVVTVMIMMTLAYVINNRSEIAELNNKTTWNWMILFRPGTVTERQTDRI